jgi:aldehyde:ferredoxin oxidoreductase
MDMVKEFHERMKGPSTQKYRTLGTVENILINNNLYCMPTRNYSSAHFENAESVSGEALNSRYVSKIIACSSCPMRCEHEAVIREGPYKGTMARMEYESLWAMGPYTGVSKLDAIVKAAELCNYYGLDAQSAGVTVGFVMDCYEKDILTSNDVGGLDAHFGNAETLLKLIELMGTREGIGDTLADGVKAAAEKIGKGSEKLAQHIKGLEVTGYDLRCLKTAALAYAVSFRGADHNRSSAYAVDLKGKVDRLKAEKGRGKIVKDLEDTYALLYSFIVCKNSRGSFYKELDDLARLYNLVTGTEITPEELTASAERINTLARLINIREGLSRKDDTLPWKVMNEPIPDDGPVKGAVVTQDELDLLLNDYYSARGWDLDGVPTAAKLKELGMEELSSIVEAKEA